MRLSPSKRERKLEAALQHLHQAAQQLRDLHDDNMGDAYLAGRPACSHTVAQAHDDVVRTAKALADWRGKTAGRPVIR